MQLPPSSSTAQSSDRGRRRPQSSKLSSKKDLAYNVWKSKKDFRSDLRAGPGFTLAERTQTSLEEHLEARKVIPLWGRDRLKSHFKAQPRFNFCPRLPKHLALGHKSKAIMGPGKFLYRVYSFTSRFGLILAIAKLQGEVHYFRTQIYDPSKLCNAFNLLQDPSSLWRDGADGSLATKAMRQVCLCSVGSTDELFL